MYKTFYVIADFFYKDLTGGAELNDYSLISQFRSRGHKVVEVYCRDATPDFLEEKKDNQKDK